MSWIPESKFIMGYYALQTPVYQGFAGGGATVYGTHTLPEAVRFDTKDECDEWISSQPGPFEWKTIQHTFINRPP